MINKKALVIFNPTAGILTGLDVKSIVKEKLNKLNYSILFLILDNNFENSIEKTDLSEISLVVAVGGDGTIKVTSREIINKKIKAPLLIIPLGSANVFANGLGLPIDLNKALNLLDNFKTIKVDVGLLDKKHYFLVGFSLGYVSAIVIDTGTKLKNKFGSFGYLLRLFLNKFKISRIKFRIEIKNKKFWIKGNSLIIFNIFKFYGFQAKKDINPYDGILNLYIVTNKKFFEMFWAIFGFLFYNKPPKPLFTLDSEKFKIRIKGKRFLKTAQIDGDPIKINKNFEIIVLHKCLEIIIDK